jgi:rod shape-determining protein MreD
MQVNDSNRNRRHILLLALLCLVLQIAISPNVGIGDGRANFALVFAAYVALTIGGRTGVLCGFLSGLVYDLSTTGPIGLMALLLTVASFVLGMEDRNRLGEDPSGSVVIFLITCAATLAAYHLAMLLVGQSSSFVDVMVLRWAPTLLLTVIAFLPFAYVGAHAGGSPLSLGGGKRSRGKLGSGLGQGRS